MEDLPLEVLRDLWLVRFGPGPVLFSDVLDAARSGSDWPSILRDLAVAGALKRRELKKGVRVTYQLKE